MKFKNLLLTLLIAFTAMPLAAQLESGKIYRFINKADANIALEASSPTDIYGAKIGDRFSQFWLAEKHPNNADAWSLRSLGNGLTLYQGAQVQAGHSHPSHQIPQYSIV